MTNTSFLNLLKYLSNSFSAASTPEAQFSFSISKKPIQFLEWLKELNLYR
ncbi:MAG: hypothetical protein E6738_04940 [Campylobacter concisus]|nr:hypothetical protein [Campylobacter concisus]